MVVLLYERAAPRRHDITDPGVMENVKSDRGCRMCKLAHTRNRANVGRKLRLRPRVEKKILAGWSQDRWWIFRIVIIACSHVISSSHMRLVGSKANK
jgi:hypothetical protein